MAIFSSSKKNKKEGAAGSSPTLGSSNGSTGAFARNASGSSGVRDGAQTQMVTQQQPYMQRHADQIQAQTSPLSMSEGPGASLSSSVNSNLAGTSSPLAVLYPWAQRKLQLKPSTILPPVDVSSLGSMPPVISGPISPPPFPRYGHSVNPTASVANGELYIFGGLVQNAVKNDLYVLNCHGVGGAQGGPSAPIGIGLVETRGEIPGPRVGHASVGVGNVLIVWGGDTKSRPEDLQDDGLYLLNLSTKEWTRVKISGPSPEGRYGHAAAMVGSKFFIFGGQRDDGGFMNDLVWFDLQKLKAGSPRWSFVDYAPNAVVPPRRTGHTTVTHGDSIYVFGGTDGQYHYNDTWCYDTNTGTWTELSCIGYIPVPREGHASTLVDDVMYVFGGRGVDGKDLEDLAAFKISNRRWFMFQNMGPAPSGRSGHAMATFQNKVFVLGGESYTSQRADDPTFVHVLDTSKIKYPADARQGQQQVARKSSAPAFNPSQEGLHSEASKSAPSLDGHDRRAVSPTGSQRGKAPHAGLGQVTSFGLIADPRGDNTSHERATVGPSGPERPARPDEDAGNRLTMDPTSSPRYSERAMSPTGSLQQRRTPHGPPSAIAQATMHHMNSAAPGSNSSHHEAARSASPSQLAPADTYDAGITRTITNGAQPPSDAFYYGTRPSAPASGNEPIRPRDVQSNSLRARDRWLTAALTLAIHRGFTIPSDLKVDDEVESSVHSIGSNSTAPPKSLEALISLRQELATMKNDLTRQAQELREDLAQTDGSRLAALKEASYYKAKAAALETGQAPEFEKANRERIRDLELRLAQVAAEKIALEERITKTDSDLDRYKQLHSSTEERHVVAANRADAAETSYSRALTDYADLQRRAHGHESIAQAHAERVVTLESSAAQLEADNRQLRQALEDAEGSLARHVRTLGEVQLALSAAQLKNDEVHSVWSRSQEELADQQSQLVQLRSELEAKTLEAAAATSKAADLERILKVTQDAHQTAQVLATGGLAELLAVQQAASMRDVPSQDDSREAKFQAIEKETVAFKQFHADTQGKLRDTEIELQDVRTREAGLHSQLVQLRAELAQAKKEAQVAPKHSRSDADGSGGETLREHARAREAAELKISVLRKVMAEHGIKDSSESELGPSRSPSLESTEVLQRQVRDLERRLEQQQNGTQSAERESSDRELEALKIRHGQLEATHLKAVQYVKGTEKMLRRMKEELTKYKTRCEELERSDREISPEKAAELETLREQVRSLTASQERTTGEQQALQRQLASLQSQHDQVRSTGDLKAKELANEVARLDEQLAKAHHDLEETLAVNASLNQELTAALKSPSSPRGTTSSDDLGRLETELNQALNKAEWLKRENVQLEERCRTAESKLLVLLDHLDSAGSENDGAGGGQ